MGQTCPVQLELDDYIPICNILKPAHSIQSEFTNLTNQNHAIWTNQNCMIWIPCVHKNGQMGNQGGNFLDKKQQPHCLQMYLCFSSLQIVYLSKVFPLIAPRLWTPVGIRQQTFVAIHNTETQISFWRGEKAAVSSPLDERLHQSRSFYSSQVLVLSLQVAVGEIWHKIFSHLQDTHSDHVRWERGIASSFAAEKLSLSQGSLTFVKSDMLTLDRLVLKSVLLAPHRCLSILHMCVGL